MPHPNPLGPARPAPASSASTRHAVWLAAIVLLITLPIAAVALPQLSLPLLLARPMDMPQSAEHDDLLWPLPEAGQETTLDWSTDISMVVGAWSAFAFPIWVAGFFLLIVRAGVGLVRLNRLRRCAEAVDGPMWQAVVARAKQQTGVNRDVHLLMSTRVRIPITWALWRVYMCLPTHADQWTSTNRRMVLAHELIHVRRGDWLWQMLVIAMTAVHWFNPLAWWAAQRLHMEAEIACDDAMLERGCGPSGYADCLYQIVRDAKAAPLHFNSALPMARPSELPIRMARVLSEKTRRRETRFQTLVLTLVMSMILGSVVAAARLGRAQPAITDHQTNVLELSPGLQADERYEEAVILIEDALEEGRITREQIGPVFDVISRLATEMKSEGTDIEIDPGYVGHLEIPEEFTAANWPGHTRRADSGSKGSAWASPSVSRAMTCRIWSRMICVERSTRSMWAAMPRSNVEPCRRSGRPTNCRIVGFIKDFR